MTYLGTNLDPNAFYEKHAGEYKNPHEDAIVSLVTDLSEFITPTVLDLGCGSGLVTKALINLNIHDVIGVDRSYEMTSLYFQETYNSYTIANFWDQLPKAKTAIAAYSLHLCKPSRIWEFRWRLKESGVKTLIVISPLKRAIVGLDMIEIARKSAFSGASKKTVWSWVLSVD